MSQNAECVSRVELGLHTEHERLILLAWIRMGLEIEYNGFWENWETFDPNPQQVLKWTARLKEPTWVDENDERRFRLRAPV